MASRSAVTAPAPSSRLSVFTRDQPRRLAQVSATYPWVGLQVLPFGTKAHPKRGGPVTILRFTETPDIGVVHLSGLNGGVCLAGPADLVGYVRAFTQLQAAALPPHRSARMLREMAGAEI